MEDNISEPIVDETIINDAELEGVEESQDENEIEQAEDTRDVEDDVTPEVNPLEQKIEKMQHGFEKRVGKLTKKYRTLEEENAQLRIQMQEQAKPREIPKDRSDFKNDEEWVDHVAGQKVRAMMAKQNQQFQEQNVARQRQNTVAESWQEKVVSIANVLPDYEEVIASVDDDTVLPAEVAEIILESEVGPQLAYYLAKNNGEVDKMSGMSERQLDRYIARLEYKVESEYKQAPTPGASVTKAKPTPKPSGNRGGGNRRDESMSDYISRRNKRLYGN